MGSSTITRSSNDTTSSASAMRWANARTTLVFPTPALPTNMGLLAWRLANTSRACSTSRCRPTTGSSSPRAAASVRFLPRDDSVANFCVSSSKRAADGGGAFFFLGVAGLPTEARGLGDGQLDSTRPLGGGRDGLRGAVGSGTKVGGADSRFFSGGAAAEGGNSGIVTPEGERRGPAAAATRGAGASRRPITRRSPSPTFMAADRNRLTSTPNWSSSRWAAERLSLTKAISRCTAPGTGAPMRAAMPRDFWTAVRIGSSRSSLAERAARSSVSPSSLRSSNRSAAVLGVEAMAASR